MTLREVLTEKIEAAKSYLAQLESAFELLEQLDMLGEEPSEPIADTDVPVTHPLLRTPRQLKPQGPSAWGCPTGVEPSAWDAWIALRVRSGAPQTEQVYARTLLELDAFEKRGFSPQRMVSNAVDRGMVGLFPPIGNEEGVAA